MRGPVAGEVVRMLVLVLVLERMRVRVRKLLVLLLLRVLLLLLLLLLRRVLLRHVLAGERQRPRRVVEEGELGAIGVAEVERAQRSVGREVERVHDC